MDSLTTNPDSDQQRRQSAHDQAHSLVVRLTSSPQSVPFSAKACLEKHPVLREFPSCVLDLAYEEYCRSREAGAAVGATEFAGAYPEVEQSLYRVIEFDQILHEHPSLIEDVPDERWPGTGDTFCGFELLEQLGRGALSRVFLARQPDLGQRRVVVKVCVRGEREADLLGQLQHKGIASIYSIHIDVVTGLAVICMPFVTRVTMHQLAEKLGAMGRKGARIRRMTAENLRRLVLQFNRPGLDDDAHSPPPQESTSDDTVADTDTFSTVVIDWSVQLSKALSVAHQRNILHCDVKPGNVLLLPDLTVSLLDFNLAWSEADASRLAGGTLPYMASEQLLALLPKEHWPDPDVSDLATAATDVYGLCATIWHMACGSPPFGVAVDAETRTDAATQMLDRQLRGIHSSEIERMHQVLPGRVVRLLIEGLDSDPRNRPQTAHELAERFERLLPPKRRRLRTIVLRNTVAIVAFVAVWFAYERNIVLTGSGSGMDSITGILPLEDSVAESRQLISEGRFDKAVSVLEPHFNSTSEVAFLDLYCRTCALPALKFEASAEFGKFRKRATGRDYTVADAEAARRAGKQILTLADEWRLLANSSDYAAESLINAAFLELELGRFKKVADCVEEAKVFEMTDLDTTRLDVVLQIVDKHTNKTYSTDHFLQQLYENAINNGTRGEAFAYVVLMATKIRETAGLNKAQYEPPLLQLAQCFAKPDFPLESDAVWHLIARARAMTRDASDPFVVALCQISEQSRATDQSLLVNALVLPPPSTARKHENNP